MAKIERNESIALEILVKVCNTLECYLNDMVEIKWKVDQNGIN